MSRLLLLALLLGLVLRRLLFPKAPPPSLAPLKAPWLFIAAALVEVGAALAVLRDLLPGEAAGPLAQAVAYALLLVGFVLNLRRPGMALAALGGVLNALVVFANGGHMPVFPEALARAGLEEHQGAAEARGRCHTPPRGGKGQARLSRGLDRPPGSGPVAWRPADCGWDLPPGPRAAPSRPGRSLAWQGEGSSFPASAARDKREGPPVHRSRGEQAATLRDS